MAAQAQTPAHAESPLRVWWMAIRVPTLPAAIVPVLVASALAVRLHCFSPIVFVVVLMAALLIQIGTNLTNDLADFRRGADTGERIGPTRVVQAGLLTAHAVAVAAALSFALAAIAGVYLVIIGGWPILAAGVASIAAGILYTAGPWPFGYHGLGDLFVFVFFGLVAVCGTFYLYAGTITPAAVVMSLPVAMLVTAILVVNNLRDIETDGRSGKRTLAVIIGANATRIEYGLLLAAAYLIVLVAWLANGAPVWLALPWASAPFAVQLLDKVRNRRGPELNPALRETALLHLIFGTLLAAGLML